MKKYFSILLKVGAMLWTALLISAVVYFIVNENIALFKFITDPSKIHFFEVILVVVVLLVILYIYRFIRSAIKFYIRNLIQRKKERKDSFIIFINPDLSGVIFRKA